MTDLNTLSREIHANAVAHGWWETDRPYAEIIALCHSELSEALEEYRDGKGMIYYNPDKPDKPEGIAVELADCAIRILDYAGRQGMDMEEGCLAKFAKRARKEHDIQMAIRDVKEALPEVVAECHNLISRAYAKPGKQQIFLATCLAVIEIWLREQGVDLWEIVRIKHEFNKLRPYRHGNKLA